MADRLPGPTPSAQSTGVPVGRSSWWSRRSLRARLTAAATLVLALGMSLAAVLLVTLLRTDLMASLDAGVRQHAQDLAALVDRGVSPPPFPASGKREALVQIVDANGRVVARSPNTQGDGDGVLFRGIPVATGEVVQARTVRGIFRGQDDDSYRVVAVAAGPPAAPVTIYVGLSTAGIDDTIDELTAALLIGLPVLVLLLGAAGWLLVGRALRPVEALRREAARIPITDLHRRLALPATADEIRRLAETLNDLLARLDAAGSRQRRFVADAAHELRSPLAALRAQLEVATHHPDATPWQSSAPDLLEDVLRLSRLVDGLLRLARLDAGLPLRRAETDLDEIVFTEVKQLRHRAAVPIDTSGVTAARLTGDEEGLGQVVRNLLDNAVGHADTRVTVSLTADGQRVTLVVADDGPGIPAAERERVFERFTRLDEARSRDDGGSGLGLAIARDVITRHGGRITVEDATPGARFRVVLPKGSTDEGPH